VPVQSVRYFACFIIESVELIRGKFSMRGLQIDKVNCSLIHVVPCNAHCIKNRIFFLNFL